MKLLILGLALILGPHQPAMGSESKVASYRYEEMRQFLGQLRNSEKLPVRPGEEAKYVEAPEGLDLPTQELFRTLINFVFRDIKIDLKTCSDCFAIAEYSNSTIYLQPNYVQELRSKYSKEDADVLMEFILLHEISHFIHEASIGAGGLKNRSLNGTTSAYSDSDLSTSIESDGYRLHAEVDTYALLLYQARHRSPPKVYLRWLEGEIASLAGSEEVADKFIRGDFEYRLNNAKTVIRDLWPDAL